MAAPQPYSAELDGPKPRPIPEPYLYKDGGQTLPWDRSEAREWWRWRFAGQIAAAICSNEQLLQRVIDGDGVADYAVGRADALIAALEQERKP